MASGLLDIFRKLDREKKELLADISSPLLLSLAALSVARETFSVEHLSAEHITACLEAAGIAVDKTSVSKALARAGDRVSKSKGEYGEVLYRLMIKGEREVSPHLGGGGLVVVRIDEDKPRTARLRLGDLLSALRGTVRICDPYYGVRTLDSLDLISSSCSVRFLTGQTNEEGRRLRGALQDFKRERRTVELRRAARPTELHDRYVLTSEGLLLVGHGLKDIGG